MKPFLSAATCAVLFASAASSGCATTGQVTPAAEAAFLDESPVNGTSLTFLVGGISCPQ